MWFRYMWFSRPCWPYRFPLFFAGLRTIYKYLNYGWKYTKLYQIYIFKYFLYQIKQNEEKHSWITIKNISEQNTSNKYPDNAEGLPLYLIHNINLSILFFRNALIKNTLKKNYKRMHGYYTFTIAHVWYMYDTHVWCSWY